MHRFIYIYIYIYNKVFTRIHTNFVSFRPDIQDDDENYFILFLSNPRNMITLMTPT